MSLPSNNALHICAVVVANLVNRWFIGFLSVDNNLSSELKISDSSSKVKQTAD